MSHRFELNEVEQKPDGTVWVSLTVFRKMEGSEHKVGGNWQWTSSVHSHFWQFKDGQLFTDGHVVTSEDDETAFVRTVLRGNGYISEGKDSGKNSKSENPS